MSGSRKFKSQLYAMAAVVVVTMVYIFTMGKLSMEPSATVLMVALGAIGGDAAVMKISNAIGDHGALKK